MHLIFLFHLCYLNFLGDCFGDLYDNIVALDRPISGIQVPCPVSGIQTAKKRSQGQSFGVDM